MKLTETEKAWMAGFLDGEGCFTFFRVAPSVKRRSINEGLNIVVSTSQVTSGDNVRIVKRFQEVFGGQFIIRKRGNENYKDICQWRILCNKAQVVCETLLPYLKIRRPQAEILLEYQRFFANQKWRKGLRFDMKRFPPEVVAYREELLGKIRKLNYRGPNQG